MRYLYRICLLALLLACLPVAAQPITLDQAVERVLRAKLQLGILQL